MAKSGINLSAFTGGRGRRGFVSVRAASYSSAVLAAAIAMAAGVSPAGAQNTTAAQGATPDNSSTVADIVVTAQRREEKLQDVGVSVAAATASQLRAVNVMDSKDIAKIAPGVIFDSDSGGSLNANLSIRGVSQSDFSAYQESPNSLYIDDVYISMAAEAAFNIYDLDRVEVLRGPQGTLFGKASDGGLASFITKRPSDQFGGYIEAGIGSYNQHYAEGAVGGPINDRIRYRLSGRAEEADGWFKNEAPGGSNSMATKFFGVRGQIEADITDRLTARLTVSYDDNPKHAEGTYKPENYYIKDGVPTPLPANVDAYGTGPGNDFNGYRDPYPDGQTGAFNNGGFLKKARFAPSLYLTWKGNNFTLSSITNYTNFNLGYAEDSDGTPIVAAVYAETQRLNQFSQEFRINGTLDRLTYTGGIYYLNTDEHIGGVYSFPTALFDNYSVSNPIHQTLNSIGVFGQVEYKFTDQLSATLGARWTHEAKDFSSQEIFPLVSPVPVYNFSPSTVGDLARERSDLFSGKAQINYQPITDVLLYGSVSHGAKGPGFNSDLGGGITVADTPFKAEGIWAYEAGAKNKLFGGRAILNLSAFYYDYTNFQGFAFENTVSIVGNYKSTFYGAEAQLTAKLPAQITVNLGTAYLNSIIHGVDSAYFGVRDEQGVNAPHWTVNGSVNKEFALGSNKLDIVWSFDYLGDRYASVDNNPATFIPGSFEHNIRVAYKIPSEGIEIAGFVNNLSDVDRENFVFDFISSNGSVLKSYARPRWFGLSVRKDF